MRQQRHALAQAFSVAHSDLVVTEVNVFDSQANAFHQAQASAVEQFGHQLMLAIHACKHGVCFSAGEDNGQLRWPRNTLDVVDEVQFSIEYLLVKKQQRTESLILSRCGDALLDSEMSEKCGDFFLAHFVWMAFAMKKNVTSNPIDVRLFGADRIMLNSQMPADAVEQFWRGSDCGCGNRHAPDRVKGFA